MVLQFFLWVEVYCLLFLGLIVSVVKDFGFGEFDILKLWVWWLYQCYDDIFDVVEVQGFEFWVDGDFLYFFWVIFCLFYVRNEVVSFYEFWVDGVMCEVYLWEEQEGFLVCLQGDVWNLEF